MGNKHASSSTVEPTSPPPHTFQALCSFPGPPHHTSSGLTNHNHTASTVHTTASPIAADDRPAAHPRNPRFFFERERKEREDANPPFVPHPLNPLSCAPSPPLPCPEPNLTHPTRCPLSAHSLVSSHLFFVRGRHERASERASRAGQGKAGRARRGREPPNPPMAVDRHHLSGLASRPPLPPPQKRD
ncbi:hypothetical protein BS50DRAFT_125183 [Corynespora cassiicola Philippines]|uniref:Uncharacterized protein n=1 Tax=Corynespora cassiicola Philippines TaxID=1448308 RepID=A0A2T2NB12_CORCC|nr:hypothetical protein BS50DRAFT_125183 [Corynespora cassiicola Philippines]